MAKWAGTLSTTEPYNHLGLLKVRQGNKNSEVFEFKLVQNGIPYDLSGYRVFFCTHFDPYVSIEKNAEIIDTKKGLIRFTMDDDCMQKVGRQEGYFEIYKEDTFLDATQYFTYTVQTSIIKQLMDGESYIQRLEELLKKLQEAMEKSQEEVEKWLEENRQKIDDLMNEMDQFFADKKNEFSEWFDSVREILESIDPGGVLLSEITRARSSDRYGTFENLDERLENIEAMFAADTKLMTINHNFKGYPRLRVLYWEYGMATRPLAMEPTGLGGGNVRTVESNVEYLDKNSLTVSVPITYKLNDPEFVFVDAKRFRLISDYRVIQVELLEDDISGYVEVTQTIDFRNKIVGSVVENPHFIGSRQNLTALNPATGSWTERNQTDIDNVTTLDGKLFTIRSDKKDETVQVVSKFDLVTDIDRRFPGVFELHGAMTREQKVAVVKKIVAQITVNASGYGRGFAGNKLELKRYFNNVAESGGVSTTSDKIAKLSLPTASVNTINAMIGQDGVVSDVLFAPASDGATPSVVNIDYVSLEYKIKVGGI
ncbi:BppU family phage baseplate upper protein [Enterococcus rotai]|uniref:BppU family phage baseplate upper protein n=1 Tax=Enterococcus rotai TaxID=118060 RepID=UPI0035C7259F